MALQPSWASCADAARLNCPVAKARAIMPAIAYFIEKSPWPRESRDGRVPGGAAQHNQREASAQAAVCPVQLASACGLQFCAFALAARLTDGGYDLHPVPA